MPRLGSSSSTLDMCYSVTIALPRDIMSRVTRRRIRHPVTSAAILWILAADWCFMLLSSLGLIHNIYTISTVYLHNIYSVSTQYLQCINTASASHHTTAKYTDSLACCTPYIFYFVQIILSMSMCPISTRIYLHNEYHSVSSFGPRSK